MKKSVENQGASPRNIASAISPPERGAKYRPLFDYLRRRPEGEVLMTLASVEIVLRALLPKSASHSEWWIVDEGDHASCSWRAAGFSAELHRASDLVRFRRTDRASIS